MASQSDFRSGQPVDVAGAKASRAANTYHPRRPHSKSRTGCLPCKARRVKCDELKPCCRRCQGRRLPCQYLNASQTPEAVGTEASRGPNDNSSLTGFESVPPAIWSLEKQLPIFTCSELQFRSQHDLRLLHHFKLFTCREMGFAAAVETLENGTIGLALEYPHLMHAVLAVGAAQLRRLDGNSSRAHTAEIRHWQSALSGFRGALTKPFTRDNCDALLLSSMLINLMTFSTSYGDNLSPLDSWVFSSASHKLNWVHVQLGLRLLLEQTKPFHLDSRLTPIFIASDDNKGTYSDCTPGIKGLPEELVKLCGLTEDSTPESSPYHLPLRLLTPLLGLERTATNTFKFTHWFASVDGKFVNLLHQKDHPALLLFCYWLGMLCDLKQWWCYERAKKECTAICIFLNAEGSEEIVRLLLYPARACDYDLGLA